MSGIEKMTVEQALVWSDASGRDQTKTPMPGDIGAMHALAEEVRRLRAVVPTWTATDVALPDDDETVLICLADGEVWTGFLDAGQWRYVSADPVGERVTHWAPMLAGPVA